MTWSGDGPARVDSRFGGRLYPAMPLSTFAPDARDGRLYVEPTGFLNPGSPGGLALAGGAVRFTLLDLVVRTGPGRIARATATPAEAEAWAVARGVAPALHDRLHALTSPRAPWAGLDLGRPRLMGIVNVTPDSFSDGGDFADARTAIAHGRAMAAAGADILDVGGESTRPGAAPVDADAEWRRIGPVIEALARDGQTVSVDTRHAATMRRALAAGARIVNDVTALAGDPESLAVVAGAGGPVCVMHMLGEPRTMQDDPRYDDVALDIYDFLEARLAAFRAAGIAPQSVAVDPGIGFGKTVQHNLDLLRRAALFHGLGVPVLYGVSRKSFIGRLSRSEPAKERLPGSLAAATVLLDRGVQILRVHDAAETAQLRALWCALRFPPASQG